MADAELVAKYKQLALEGEEDDDNGVEMRGNQLASNPQEQKWCMVGSFNTDRPINFASMRGVLASIWRPLHGMWAKDLEPNLFIFQFFHEKDFHRVVSDAPWTFDQHLLVFKELLPGENPLEVQLNRVYFWVQVYDLPFGFMSEAIARDIGNYIGIFVDSDSKNFTGMWRTYMRIRISIDIRIKHKECLHTYEIASGQKVNFNKSSIVFSPNTSEQVQDSVCQLLMVSKLENHGKYLGAPSLIGRNKKAVFSFVKEKAWKRLNSWHSSFFSRAGKEVLLKSVIQAIPSYIMSVFLLPVDLCADLERMMNSFWWGKNNSDSKGIHWRSWKNLCPRKVNGGLGFRRIPDFNIAMLAKQSWRLQSNPESLVAKIYKSKYYQNNDFVHASISTDPSCIWRGLVATQDLIKKGLRWRVGIGETLSVWNTPWLIDKDFACIQSEPFPGFEDAKVSSLMHHHSAKWDIDLLNSLFDKGDMLRILATPLPRRSILDCQYWCFEKRGVYTVRSGYRALTEPLSSSSAQLISWATVWNLQVQPKVKNFMWRVFNNCLPTKVALIKKRVDLDPSCPSCSHGEEDSMHILVRCSFARSTWRASKFGDNAGSFISISEWWNFLCSKLHISDRDDIASILWALWQQRNARLWKGKTKPPSILLKQALEEVQDWKQVHRNQQQASITSRSVQKKWKPPPADFLKCNIDASTFSDIPASGYGAIIRDSNGFFIAALQGIIPGDRSALLAESIAIREVLSWLKFMNVPNVLLESDSQTAVEAIRGSEVDISHFGAIIDDCRFYLNDLAYCNIQFVRRSANSVAHSLARAAYSLSDSEVWSDVPPSFILDVMAADLVE